MIRDFGTKREVRDRCVGQEPWICKRFKSEWCVWAGTWRFPAFAPLLDLHSKRPQSAQAQNPHPRQPSLFSQPELQDP